MTKTAFIMIAGKPNVGKSTLLNTLLGEKIAIVSRKPQTTRNRITGVLTKGENQYVFTDTPGLHKPKTLLGEYMMKSVGNVADSSDIVASAVYKRNLDTEELLDINLEDVHSDLPAIPP